MNETINSCDFCNIGIFEGEGRLIQEHELFFSVVSWPNFRIGQCLVVPRRHTETPQELTAEEGGAIIMELGRLGTLVDQGYGTGILQKYQPTQPENGIKMNHLHFHTFPRIENEPGLFPVPEPNSFDGFFKPDLLDIQKLAQELRP